MNLKEALKNITENGNILEDSMICIFKKKVHGYWLIFENPTIKERKLVFCHLEKGKSHVMIEMDEFLTSINEFEADYENLPD